MKSKISLFNRTIFLKNLTLFWPIWGGYLLYLLITQPGFLQLQMINTSVHEELYTNAANYVAMDQQTVSYHLSNMLYVLDTRVLIVQTVVMAVFTGMALFHYLCVVKNTNMIHALPVTRGELFGTNVISGLIFMVVPQVISFFLMMAVCLGNGVSQVEYLGIFVLLEIGISVLWYGITVFCAMLTGQMFAIPVFFMVVNLLFVVLRVLVNIVINFYAYGVQSLNSVFRCVDSDILSPLFFLFERLRIEKVWNEDSFEYIEVLDFRGCGYVAVYLLAAVAFFTAAYVLYRKRHLEHAGDLVSFGFARPLFRWGVGFFSFYIMGMAGMALEEIVVYEVKIIPALMFGVVFSILAFFISQMILEKSFRVFKINYIKECGCMLLFVFCTLVILCGYSYRIQEFVPEEEQIRDVSIQLDYDWTVPQEDYDKVCSLHKLLLDFGEKNYKWKNISYSDVQGGVYISYQLKNGKLISRYYEVPYDFEGQELIDYLRKKSLNADDFLEYIIGSEYREGTASKKWSNISLYCNTQTGEMDDIQTENFSTYSLYDKMGEEMGEQISGAEADEIYEAVIADAKAGTLQKYNAYWGYQEMMELDEAFSETNDAILSMSWEIPNDNNDDYDSWDVSIRFGNDCENIIKVLKECLSRHEIRDMHIEDD